MFVVYFDYMTDILETAIFGGGCFWCTEAIFRELRGVQSVVPGYAGGTLANPTYEAVCGGNTGHAEVIKIEFDSRVIAFRDLLEVFFLTHDPTTMNRQGNDVGEQYRSIILYTSPAQKEQAEKMIMALTASGEFKHPIVTQIKPLDRFYKAEDYHHNYYAQNQNKSYCRLVINPKLIKLRKKFAPLLRNEDNPIV